MKLDPRKVYADQFNAAATTRLLAEQLIKNEPDDARQILELWRKQTDIAEELHDLLSDLSLIS